ncbi:MAG: hypothetical protein FWH07_03035 [Oscillospiraceae bacterium]|nr:hypothetical protein [Oscillospiraceae bacterium]
MKNLKISTAILLTITILIGFITIPTTTATQYEFTVNTDNATIIGFGGKQWAVIGHDGEGVASATNTLTLLLANVSGNTYGISVFRTGQESDPGDNTMKQTLVANDNYWYANNPQEPNWSEPREYLGSTLQQRLDEIANVLKTSSPKEEPLIIPRNLPGNGGDMHLTDVAGPAVKNARLWALSLGEAQNVNEALREFSTWWWLRSPGRYSYIAAYVRRDGFVYDYGDDVRLNNWVGGVRPALQLNLEDVLFTSDNTATGGKSATTIGGGFVQLQPSNNIKFTMSHDSLELADVTPTNRVGNVITFDYNGATAGKTLSALVMRDGEVAYYGKLVENTSENGTDVALNLPGDFDTDTDKVQLFVEEANGVNETDFASAFVELAIPCDYGLHNYGEQTDCTIAVNCEVCGLEMIKARTHTVTEADCTECADCMTELTKTCTIINSCAFHQLTIGFGGKQWAVIGHDSVGDDTPSSTLTLMLANGQSYGPGAFRTGQDIQFDNSTQHTDNWWYANNPQEPNWNEPNEYRGSALQQRLEEIADGLPTKENALIIPRELLDVSVETARLWALSSGEARNVNNTLREFSSLWWLRSPGNFSNDAAFVFSGGVIVNGSGSFYIRNDGGVRPALQLNLESVIFTSANTATGGKSATTIGGRFVQLQPSNNIKFTMLHDSLELASVTPTARDGDTITFDYNGATAAKTLSAVVMRNDEVAHYGKLVDGTDENGTASLILPDDFDTTTDTIQLFVEETNGVNQTDFASEFVELGDPCGYGLHNYGKQTDCTVKVDCKDCGSGVIGAKEHVYDPQTDCTVAVNCEDCELEMIADKPHISSTLDCTICSVCSEVFEAHTPTAADCTECEDCPIIFGTHNPTEEDCTACEKCTAILREHRHGPQTDLTVAVRCDDCGFEVFAALPSTEFSIVGDKIVIRNNTNKFISTKGYYLTDGTNEWALPVVVVRSRSAVVISGGKRVRIGDLSGVDEVWLVGVGSQF